jgi:excisionase family DNA binding protein
MQVVGTACRMGHKGEGKSLDILYSCMVAVEGLQRDKPGQSDWWHCPRGHMSVKDAAKRLGVSRQRVDQLVRAGKLHTYSLDVGIGPSTGRVRVWVSERDVEARHAEKVAIVPAQMEDASPNAGAPSVETPMPRAADKAASEAVARERDMWRAQALRLREAGRLMAEALDALQAAQRHRVDADRHQRETLESLHAAIAEVERATERQTEALRQFMLPGDLDEN